MFKRRKLEERIGKLEEGFERVFDRTQAQQEFIYHLVHMLFNNRCLSIENINKFIEEFEKVKKNKWPYNSTFQATMELSWLKHLLQNIKPLRKCNEENLNILLTKLKEL